MTVEYTLRLLNSTGNHLEWISEFTSLEWAIAENEVGQMTLTFPQAYFDYNFWQPDYIIEIWRTIDGVKTLIGDTGWFIRNWRYYEEEGEKLAEITAYDAKHLLTRRIVAYDAETSYTEKTAAADDMMKQIVTENFSTGQTDALREWSTDYFTVQANASLAESITKAFSRQNVYSLLKTICDNAEDNGDKLIFDIIRTGHGKFEFRVYYGMRGVDRSSDSDNRKIISVEAGNLVNPSLERDHVKEINYVYAGGQGIAEDRVIGTASDDGAIAKSYWNRIEDFTINNLTDDTDVLNDVAKEEIAKLKAKTIFSGEISDCDGTRFGIDYHFGDILPVSYMGVTIDCHVAAAYARVKQPSFGMQLETLRIKLTGEIIGDVVTITPEEPEEPADTTVYYYVDATGGDDDNSGLTEALAWQTVAKVNATSFNPDDNILFKRGETWTEQLAPTSNGTSGHPIIYGAYGTGARPVISKAASCAFYINDDYNNMRFDHLDFTGSTGSYSTIYCYDAHDLYFYDCIARDAGARHGISCNGSAHTVYNITFDGCEMKDNAKSGTYTGTLTSHDILFTNCTAHDNGSDADADHGFYIGGGVICDGCTAYDNTGGGFKMNDNESEPSLYPITRNCVSYGNNYGIIFTHKNALAHDNLVYGSLTANILVYGNTWGGYKAYFNTLVNAVSASYRGSFLFTAGLSPSCDFRNNLLIQDAAVVTKANLHFDGALGMASYDDAFDYNVYYYSSTSPTTQSIIWDGSLSATKNWTNWLAAGAEAHGTLLTSTPDFVTRYTDCHPADAGDLKGKGVAISGYGTDKDGNARADPPTPGCYETEG